ncbi:hypothetical protein BGZ60DRAFT_414992 [Tricladium varicosporioides]|nr:hypothetical protein BGZ60DRAFT_414992 [Hymenoscyphus varicosporioides]
MQVVKLRRPRQTSCTECIRRKQKCQPGNGKSCYYCSRRHPPVLCKIRDAGSSGSSGSSGAREERAQKSTESTTTSMTVGKRSHPYCEPQSFGSYLSAAQCANISPADPSQENIELLHSFQQYVAPMFSSVDGRTAPDNFLNEWTPWILQSPLMPEISILLSLSIKCQLQGLDTPKCPNALAMRGNIYSLLGKFLTHNIERRIEQTIHAVLHLIGLESFWGESNVQLSHVKAIQNLLRMGGGIEQLTDLKLKKLLMITDFHWACSYERELLFHQSLPADFRALPIPNPYPENFDSPLLDFSSRFVDRKKIFGLEQEVAEMLDLVRSLTNSVLSSTSNKRVPESDSYSFQLMALEALNKLEAFPSLSDLLHPGEEDLIYETCRMAACAYSFSILTKTPFSKGLFADSEFRQQFYSNLWRVSLARWQEIPGIFFWLTLIACPGSGETYPGVRLKAKMTATSIYIMISDFDLAIGASRAFWTVQRWIARREAEGTEFIISGEELVVTPYEGGR